MCTRKSQKYACDNFLPRTEKKICASIKKLLTMINSNGTFLFQCNNNQESYKDVIFLSVSNHHLQALIFCISLFNIKTEDQHLAQKKGRAI